MKFNDIDKSEVFRYLGYDESVHHMSEALKKDIDKCIEEILRVIDIREALSPILPITLENENMKVDTMNLVGSDIKAHLKGSDRVILMAVTLGNMVDYHIKRAEAINMTNALIMDAVANVAIETAAGETEKRLREMVTKEGLFMTGRYSPGYGDMPLSSQKDLLNIVGAERKAGITLTPTNLMIPRKSITAIIGVADHPVSGKLAGCNHCVMRDKCSYRKRGTTCDK